MKRVKNAAVFVVLLFLCSSTDAGATSSLQNKSAPVHPAVTRPEVVYVTDFELDAGDIQKEAGLLQQQGGGRLREGILHREGGILGQGDPESKAVKLTELLAASVVDELRNRSVPAVRLRPGQTIPRKGWIIRGEFVEVDEGNRVRRAVVGFGAGATNMEIDVQVADLGTYPDEPFLLFGTKTGSGKMPGAVVTLNPYVAAAKFVLSKNASDKDVKHAAAQIAAEIVGYMSANKLLPGN